MVKQLIRKWFRAFGYDVVRYLPAPEHPIPILPYLIDAVVATEPDFFFVQIGANDGVRNDPIRESVVRHRLKGLFVEPMPDYFSKLREHYRGFEGMHFEQAAVAPSAQSVSLFRIRPDAPLPAWAQGIASLDRGHLSGKKFGIPGLEQHVEEILVPGITFEMLMAKHNINRVSLLQVDAEGFDCDVVTMALRFGLRPKLIHYEYVHCTPAQRLGAKRLLADAGYDYLDYGRDTVAMLRKSETKDASHATTGSPVVGAG